MKFRRVSIDGYGRFSNRVIDFSPGLQVILGPNEQGKSTLRAFIGDMLYGQKCGLGAHGYDENQSLRKPWQNPDCYGGSLRYALDNERLIEVIRNFDPQRESLQIFDRTEDREITGDFERLRNGESSFAQAHLGISKEVFHSTATITHVTLEDLGDLDALAQVREKLLSLADSGEETVSANQALARLKDRVAAIGPATARNKPLPRARQREAELERERDAVLALRSEMTKLAAQRQALREEAVRLRGERARIEDDLAVIEAHSRASRLHEIESLLARIDAATQHCFALGAVRDFPIDQQPVVQRAENDVAQARTQLARTRAEEAQVRQQLEAEQRRGQGAALAKAQGLPEADASDLAELNETMATLRRRATELEQRIASAEADLAQAEAEVAGLPDFGRVASDPVEWFSQLASSFGVAVRTRDEEQSEFAQLESDVQVRRRVVTPYRKLFAQVDDFPAAAREYTVQRQVRDEQQMQRSAYLESLETTVEDMTEDVPGNRWLGLLSLVCALGLLAAFFYLQRVEVLYAVGACGLLALFFALNLIYTRSRVRRLTVEVDKLKAEQAASTAALDEDAPLIDRLIEQAGCTTLKELEARYDLYREAAAELQVREQALEAQRQRTEEAADRVRRLLERLAQTFGAVGEAIKVEEDIAPASSRVLAAYQGYRDAKRRVYEARGALERLRAQAEQHADEQRGAEAALATLRERILAHLKAQGFARAESFAQPQEAIRAFEIECAQAREQMGRLQLLGEKLEGLAARAHEEESALERQEQELGHQLARSGAASIEEWYRLAEQAREYREIWNKRTVLQEQLDAQLRGQSLGELRAAVEDDGTLPPMPEVNAALLESERQGLTTRIDELLEQEHELHLEMTRRLGGTRALNDIEEELERVAQQVRDLEEELEATTYAMALIEEIARDKHARIAPVLANLASDHLAEITGGAYGELMLSRDLTISMRIPATRRLHENPEKSLSKGTVDQVYLALRLALVRAMSQNSERIPMLLDDPFANYDDERLDRTMALVARLAKENQVLLFTCREDVARAAERVQAPVITL